jgi:hypothetical protein
MTRYPAAVASGLDPAEHYVRQGAVAGFSPGPRFDASAYLIRYGDVRRSGMNPLAHYVQYGNDEGRVISAVGSVAETARK